MTRECSCLLVLSIAIAFGCSESPQGTGNFAGSAGMLTGGAGATGGTGGAIPTGYTGGAGAMGGTGGAIPTGYTGGAGATGGTDALGGTGGTGGTDATGGTGGTGGSGGTGGGAPDTECTGSYNGMPGSTSDLTLNGRNYTLHIGSTVTPNQASPLVFSLHGLTMTPASMEFMAGWDPVADREGIIIARPAGVGNMNSWDITGNTDFDLMAAIIEDVNTKACVDRKRIYATGFSMGGFMSFAMACRMGDVIAAVGPCSGGGSTSMGCTARPVPVYAWHGDADGTVAYSSGQSAVQSWVSHNGCMGSPISYNVGTANCQHWDSCNDNGDVKFCTIPGGGHTYTRAATEELWTFFKEHPLP